LEFFAFFKLGGGDDGVGDYEDVFVRGKGGCGEEIKEKNKIKFYVKMLVEYFAS